jgi:hypothetical protein
MKTFPDRFILGIPRLYIKQFPYAWIVFIALWTWPPNLSWIFLFIILVGLLMVQWHHSAWMSTIRNEYASHGGKFYVDRPPVPLQRAVRNISILCAGAGVISFFLNRQIGLTTGQVFSDACCFFTSLSERPVFWSTNHICHYVQLNCNLLCSNQP